MILRVQLERDDGTLIWIGRFNALEVVEQQMGKLGDGPVIVDGLNYWGFTYIPRITDPSPPSPPS